MQYRWGGTVYAMEVQQLPRVSGAQEVRVVLDGVLQEGAVLPLQDDGGAHTVLAQVSSPGQPMAV